MLWVYGPSENGVQSSTVHVIVKTDTGYLKVLESVLSPDMTTEFDVFDYTTWLAEGNAPEEWSAE